MEGVAIFLIVLGALLVAYWFTFSRRRKALKAELDANRAGKPKATGDLFEAEVGQSAPVADFTVHGVEARVTFDVPLPGDDDQVLNDLLMEQAIEVVREKRHTLPIDDVTHIVALAGRDPVTEIGRTELKSPGDLPPPVEVSGLSLAHVAKDPFAGQFEGADHSVAYDTRVDVPSDELRPLRDEINLPKGLERGLRATGVDPAQVSGPELAVALLKLFGYSVSDHAFPGSYMASKGGVSTYIATDAYSPGDHPEMDEAVIRKFLADFGSSGADRGMMLSDKYGPFLVHEIESRQPKVRFITRERLQRFIDSMALG